MGTTTKIIKGDCDCCVDSRDVVLYGPVNSMMMCESCYGKQNIAVEAQKTIDAPVNQPTQSVTNKTDIFVAETTAFMVLQSQILSDTTISEADRKYALAQAVEARINEMTSLIFGHKEALANIETQRFAWMKNLQPLVATLRVDQQAKFSHVAVNYKPVQPTTSRVKKAASTPRTQSASSFKPNELKDAVKKYGMPADAIRATMLQYNMNADAAGRRITEIASGKK